MSKVTVLAIGLLALAAMIVLTARVMESVAFAAGVVAVLMLFVSGVRKGAQCLTKTCT